MDRLVVSALKMETSNGSGNYDLLHTGVGKVNATMALTNFLTTKDVKEVLEQLKQVGQKEQ